MAMTAAAMSTSDTRGSVLLDEKAFQSVDVTVSGTPRHQRQHRLARIACRHPFWSPQTASGSSPSLHAGDMIISPMDGERLLPCLSLGDQVDATTVLSSSIDPEVAAPSHQQPDAGRLRITEIGHPRRWWSRRWVMTTGRLCRRPAHHPQLGQPGQPPRLHSIWRWCCYPASNCSI